MFRHRLMGYHLLLVEDEPMIGDDARLNLEEHGAEILGPALESCIVRCSGSGSPSKMRHSEE
jgi:hypothetical protein